VSVDVNTCICGNAEKEPGTHALPLDTTGIFAPTYGEGRLFGEVDVTSTLFVPADTTPASNVPPSKIKFPDVGWYATHVTPSHIHDALFSVYI
jgi:hypothetical protein